MKSILVSSLLFLLAISSTTAQDKPSPEAEAFFNKAMSEINASHIRSINAFGLKMHIRNLPDSEAHKMAREYVRLVKLSNNDIEAMTFFILMQASKSAQEDLKAIMNSVKAINKQKQELRDMQSILKEKQQSVTSVQLDSFNLLRSKTIAIQKSQNPDTVKLVRSNSVVQKTSKAELGLMKKQIKDDLDSLSEIGEQQQLKMQIYMERQNKANTAASNTMKKFSETQDEIIGNFK